MSRISGRETKPEILVRKHLFSKGFRYRKHVKSLPGKPDIVLAKYRSVILIHGCFWHGHEGCRASRLPDTRRDFWEKKIRGNILRDERLTEELKRMDWKVIVVWQCEISSHWKRRERFETLIRQIRDE